MSDVPVMMSDVYITLTCCYNTLLCVAICFCHTGVPAMSFANRDKARRFITLVDELYNARVALVCRCVLCILKLDNNPLANLLHLQI